MTVGGVGVGGVSYGSGTYPVNPGEACPQPGRRLHAEPRGRRREPLRGQPSARISTPPESALKPDKPIPLAGIVPFDSDGSPFTLNQAGFRHLLGIDRPFIRAKEPDRPAPEAFRQPGKSGLIAIAAFSVKEMTGITARSFPEPELVFFECKQGRTSSSSTRSAWPGSGFS